MTADILPAGEQGEYTVSEAQLMRQDYRSLEEFFEKVTDEALRRGLELNLLENRRDGSVTVRWRPER